MVVAYRPSTSREIVETQSVDDEMMDCVCAKYDASHSFAKTVVQQDCCRINPSWRASFDSWSASTSSLITDDRCSWRSAAKTVVHDYDVDVDDLPASSAAHHGWDSHIDNDHPAQRRIGSPAPLEHSHFEDFFGLQPVRCQVQSSECGCHPALTCGFGPALIEAHLPYDTHADTRLQDILILLTQGRKTVP